MNAFEVYDWPLATPFLFHQEDLGDKAEWEELGFDYGIFGQKLANFLRNLDLLFLWASDLLGLTPLVWSLGKL